MTPFNPASLALAAVIAAMLGAAMLPAVAQSPLKELRARQAEEAQLKSEAAYTSNVCGKRIGAAIDWARSRDWPADESLAEACDTALGAVETMCRSGRLDDMRTDVTSLTCMGNGAGAALDGGTLIYGASPGKNGYRETLDVLEGEL